VPDDLLWVQAFDYLNTRNFFDVTDPAVKQEMDSIAQPWKKPP
jgi:hypothetical protein